MLIDDDNRPAKGVKAQNYLFWQNSQKGQKRRFKKQIGAKSFLKQKLAKTPIVSNG